MLPSNMLLEIGVVVRYNNKLSIADNGVQIGMINQHINIKQKVVPTKTTPITKKSRTNETSMPHKKRYISFSRAC